MTKSVLLEENMTGKEQVTYKKKMTGKIREKYFNALSCCTSKNGYISCLSLKT